MSLEVQWSVNMGMVVSTTVVAEVGVACRLSFSRTKAGVVTMWYN